MPDLNGQIGLDTTDFKTSIASMNRELRVLESEFRAGAAALGDWGSSADGLRSRVESLNEQMEVQKRKVEALTAEHQRVAEAQGADSRAAQDLQIKLNQATEQLNKMQNEASTASGKIEEMGNDSTTAGGKVEELGGKQEKAGQESEKMGGKMEAVKGVLVGFGAAVGSAAAAVAGIAGAISGMVMKGADAAGNLVDLSNKTGISTTKLQEYAYIGEQVGVTNETITGSLARLTRSMDEARGQQQAFDEQLANGVMEDEINVPMDYAASFNKLGVEITDANGQLRDQEDVLTDALAALGKIDNEAERDALSMQIFGRSAMELNPLIKTSADEMAAMAEEGRNLGAIMEEEDVGGLEAFGDQLAGLKAGLQGTLGTLASAFLPAFSGLAGTAQTYLGQFSSIVKGADGDLSKMAGGVGQLVGQIVSDLAKSGPEMLEGGLSILTGITTAIVENIPVIMPAIVQMLMMLVQFVIESLPLLLTAAVQIILALATGIASALPQLIPTIMGIIPVVISTLLENLPLLIGAALQIIIALVQGLVAALPELIKYIPELIVAIFDTIIETLPVIGDAAVEIIVALVNGLIESIPLLITAVVQLWEGMKEKFVELWDEVKTVGNDLVAGIWEGIKEKATWLYDKVKDFFQNLFKTIQDEEESHSPSEKWARMGAWMAQGLGLGFSRQWAGVEGQIAGAVAGLSGIDANPNVNLSTSGAGSAAGGTAGAGNTYQYYFNFKDTTLTEAELERILARQELMYGV